MSAEQDKAVVRRWFRACNDRDLPAEEAAHIPGVPGPQDGDGGGRVGRPSRHEHAAVYRGVARGASPPRKLLKGTVNAYGAPSALFPHAPLEMPDATWRRNLD